MDDLNYFYKANSNQLRKVTNASSATYSNYNDIKTGQADNNYQYDEIGNLVKDNAEGITNVSWTVYGKIASITKSGSTIKYIYDASGNRIMKQTATDTTVYVRDASGNVMSVYSKPAGGTLVQSEMHIYGSSRIGMATQHITPDTSVVLSGGFTIGTKRIFTRGEKLFELTNHLGNVLVTISDKRVQVSSSGTTIDYYKASVVSAQDYFPFGMLMPGRKFSSSSNYRYGYGGHEEDDEVKGVGNHLSFGDYGYDPRLGRRMNIDPLGSQFPWQSPYVVFNNNPIYFSDPTGLSGEPPTDQKVIKTADNSFINVSRNADVETFGTNQIQTTGGASLSVDPNAAMAFTVDGKRYVAGFNKDGSLSGYFLASDMKTQYAAEDLIYQDKISDGFKGKLLEISYNLGHDPNKLMAVFAQETGETFDPSITSGDSQVGLIQFTGAAITQINSTFKTEYTKAQIVKMSAEEQLVVVQQYFQSINKTMVTIDDYALATFSPKNVGKPSSTVIYSKGSDRYTKNKGLDTNKDGKITVGEVGAKYAKKYVKQ